MIKFKDFLFNLTSKAKVLLNWGFWLFNYILVLIREESCLYLVYNIPGPCYNYVFWLVYIYQLTSN